ncbi:DNA polymerase III subunit delta' [Symbiobacterium thermophilum]|uniref:DNA polymerase III subunit delta' n=2 Tax=Symbiobacterium thermophilum TaxID=2734 RepID=Q67JB2_SYMTH|nr:DNA polymerase III subunit delta' [Symbiobacterium thermophilum]MBY6276672.1 DNA polymerase III subunit delta' [Symbiobacterium thermophilum]BAD42238.1 DNA polymerase III delta' subunit [Symbiobacterium thermophilum IAM 14863]
MTWSAIRGQRMAVDLLRRAVAGGRVAHAYLFAGPAGVGKRLVALELARSLNCLEPRAGEACGACRSCLKLSAEPPVHPDVTVVEPEGRMIRTEQMRQVQNEVYARPTEGRYKVVIIDGAERMNAESGNRLLKVLEEPPPYACFVLLTTNAAGVLPTIVSRCQIVHFSPLPAEAIAAVLQEKAGIGPGEARLFASLSGGSVGAALAMAANPEVGRRRDEALSLLLRLGEMDDADLLEQAAAWEKEKDHLEERLEMAAFWLRDALLVAREAPERLVVNADRLPEVRTLAGRYGGEGLVAALESLSRARDALLRNGNARLVLDVLMLDLHGAARF